MSHLKFIALGVGSATMLAAPMAQAATLHDGTYDGGVYDAYYGPMQVEITVQGGAVISAKAVQFPGHRHTSVTINNYALPMLAREVIKVQNAKVHIISGATLSCDAYVASLVEAFQKASQ